MKRLILAGFGLLAIVEIVSVIVADARKESPSNTGTTVGPCVGSAPAAKPAVPESYWKVNPDSNAVTGEITRTAFLQYQGERNIYIRQKGKKPDCYINTG